MTLGLIQNSETHPPPPQPRLKSPHAFCRPGKPSTPLASPSRHSPAFPSDQVKRSIVRSQNPRFQEMGKRNKKSEVKPSSMFDLKSIIHENALFFDKLIDLIPAKFYLPVDDKEKPWFQGLSKSAKAEAKKESKENIKKARRDRLDPEKSLTTLDLLKQSIDKEKSDEESEEEEIEVRPVLSGLEDDDKSVTYEELRQRLRRKIEELRGGRHSGNSERVKKKNEKGEKQKNPMKKRKRDSLSKVKNSSAGNPEDDVEQNAAEAAKELTFTRVKLGDEDKIGKNKKRKVSKHKKLECALKLEEAKKDPEKGETIAKKHSWNAAMSRAAGIKVHDDPKLIKQSMKREEKRHQKSAEKWKERLESTQKKKTEKQQKRSDNIAGKIQQKKVHRIEKREKKLLRPGFEGRKAGFINEGSS